MCYWPTKNFSNIKSNLIFSFDLQLKHFIFLFEHLNVFFTSTFFLHFHFKVAFALIFFSFSIPFQSKGKKWWNSSRGVFRADAKITFLWNAWNMKMIKMWNKNWLLMIFFDAAAQHPNVRSGSENWFRNNHSVVLPKRPNDSYCWGTSWLRGSFQASHMTVPGLNVAI